MTKEYKQTEELIMLVMADIVNGVPRSDILTKLKEGMYEGQKKPYKEVTALDYYYTAMDRIKMDMDEDIDDLRSKLYSQYYMLFADAVRTDNTIVAKQVLDSIAKYFVGDTMKLNLDGKVDEKISIDFSFS